MPSVLCSLLLGRAARVCEVRMAIAFRVDSCGVVVRPWVAHTNGLNAFLGLRVLKPRVRVRTNDIHTQRDRMYSYMYACVCVCVVLVEVNIFQKSVH